MSEETKAPEAPKAPETPKDDANPEVKGILHDLQSERAKRQELQSQLDKIQKDHEKAEQKRLEEQNQFQELYEVAQKKVEEYEPLVNQFKTERETRKADLLEKLGDDADDFSGLDVPALEKVVAKLSTMKPPGEPGRPGTTKPSEYEGMTWGSLATKAAQGDTKARDEINRRNKAGA